jgi:hypothetical protein
LERSRKLFESSGLKLSDIAAPLRTLQESLLTLEQAESLNSFGGKCMRQLVSVSDNLSVRDGKMQLKWSQHTWQVSLRVSSGLDGMLALLIQTVSTIREQCEEHFPAAERDFAIMLSIFDIGVFQHMTVFQSESFGDTEICALIDKLSTQQISGMEFYCQTPFISRNQKPEVRFMLA